MSYKNDQLTLKYWPKCVVCGKGAREGNHATDLGSGHDYVPSGAEGLAQRKGRLDEHVRR